MLALVGEGGASATDIARMVGQGRELYYAAAPSQLYREPKRLAKLGYLSARVVPGRTRPRTLYRLTPTGRRALRSWLAGPSTFPRIQNEAHLRLLAGDMVDDAAIVASFTAMLPQLDELDAKLDGGPARRGAAPGSLSPPQPYIRAQAGRAPPPVGRCDRARAHVIAPASRGTSSNRAG